MLLVVGGRHDAEALSAVARLGLQQGSRRAALLSAEDLSRPGWQLNTDDPAGGSIVADGRVVAVRDLSAVLVRRLIIYPEELQHVHAEDRAYVASEMTALLAWWLRVVPVPVLNRPQGAVLCGPGLRPERWRALAGRLGFPVICLRRNDQESAALPAAVTDVVLIGDVFVGNASARAKECVAALAREAGVDLLFAAFDAKDALVTAHTLPRLSGELIDAVAEYARRDVGRQLDAQAPSAMMCTQETLAGAHR